MLHVQTAAGHFSGSAAFVIQEHPSFSLAQLVRLSRED